MPAPIIKDMALRLNGDVLAHIVKPYNGREAAAPKKKPKRFILERDCIVDHKKEAVEDFFSWLADNNGEDTIALIRKTKGSIPYGAFADYARSHPQLRRRCTFKAGGSMNGKDKGYMKLLRMYMQAVKMYFHDGPVVATSEAAGETAVAEYSHTKVHTTAVARGLHMNFPAIHSITIRTPKKNVKYTVKAMISVNGSKTNRQGDKPQKRGDRRKQRYRQKRMRR